jgi:AsmA protein
VKIVKFVGLLLAGVVVLAALVLAFGVPAHPFVTYISEQAEKAGYRLRVDGASHISVFPYLNVSAGDIRLAEGKDSREDLLTAKEVRFALSLSSLLAGDIRVTDIVVTQPVVRLVSGRRAAATRSTAQSAKVDEGVLRNVAIDSIRVENGTLIVRDAVENLEGRIDALQLTASVPTARGPLDVKADGRAGGQPVRLVARANSLSQIVEGRATPIEATLEMPDLVKGPMKLTATMRAADLVGFDSVRGTLGSERFNGSLSIDPSGPRPFVTANFNFDRLELKPVETRSGTGANNEPWSDRPADLTFLRVFDAAVKVSAGELSVQNIRVAPAEIEGSLAGGLLSLQLSRADLYGGPVQGKLVLDAGETPRIAGNVQFSKVNGRQFLTDMLGFDHLEGRLQGRFELDASGASPQALASSLSGTIDLLLEDGAIRDVDVPSMVRALTSQTLQGWQDKGTAQTELTSLSVKFRLANGRATTDDVRLAGPLVRMTGKGSADLVGRTLDFRVDPKLVLTLQGQGGTGDPAGLGVPVVIRGPWDAPQIHPDISGILENPQAAFDQLRRMGGALFGQGGGRRPSADEVMKSVDDLIRGRQPSNQPGQSGRQPSTQDLGNQVRDRLRDFLGR